MNTDNIKDELAEIKKEANAMLLAGSQEERTQRFIKLTDCLLRAYSEIDELKGNLRNGKSNGK